MLRTFLITIALVTACIGGCRNTTAHRHPCCGTGPTVVGTAPVAAPCCTPGVAGPAVVAPGVIPPGH